MGFRRAKSRAHEDRETWGEWIDLHRRALGAIGLPPEVYLSADHWSDFLENGYLEWHPQDRTGFTFDDLPSASAGALWRLLEVEYGGEERCPPLLGWLRVRRQEGKIA
jgi:hypothetical protein